MKNFITIKVRLFAGLERDADVDDYDRNEGITLNVPEGMMPFFLPVRPNGRCGVTLPLKKLKSWMHPYYGERIQLRRKIS